MSQFVDFHDLTLVQLLKRGFMRWGKDPVPNLMLIPASEFKFCRPGTMLTGIDGKSYMVGSPDIDMTQLMGYLAYGFIRLPSIELQSQALRQDPAA